MTVLETLSLLVPLRLMIIFKKSTMLKCLMFKQSFTTMLLLDFVCFTSMDDVILWCQEMLGKEYIVNGKVAGKDLDSTRAPQRYGFSDLDTFMRVNGYLAEPAVKEAPATATDDDAAPMTAQ